ncbi:hypothetical protein SAMN04488505_102127 [Chitinophaga rupis]|uniref:Uncharacterized protein n=1 Tax=Chitinophaga rupis TaxID=573321 RepID=A0A1H7PMY6_9BACT|nr:hypothetical protein [Chitinophaga rupis]SEL37201.1 hypothetical protein SAMN04488505_102127 [Chitinophaga rupis]
MKVPYIRSSKFLTVIFWVIITIAAFALYRKESTSAVIQYNSTQDFDIYITDKLKWITSPDSHKVGHAGFIMSLNDTLGRHVTDIWLTEGELDTQKINPYNDWKKLLQGTNAIIVIL